MEQNDRFSRQNGEDTSTHFARLARELWGCVDDLKRVSIPELERRLGTFERQMDRANYDRERDLAVHREEQKATEAWRSETYNRLKRLEEQVDAIRVAAGVTTNSKSAFEIDIKTLVVAAITIGAVIYGFFQQGIGQ